MISASVSFSVLRSLPPHHPAQFSDDVQDGGAGAPGAIADGVAVQLLLDVKAQNLLVRNQTLSWAAHDGSPARDDVGTIAGCGQTGMPSEVFARRTRSTPFSTLDN
jgi:hypothetical protein